MGTRGAIGFRIDGKDKIEYNHSDSYPSALGAEVWNYLRGTNPREIKDAVRAIELVNNSTPPSAEQIERCKKFGTINLGVSEGSTKDWYCVLRGAQGNLGKFVEVGLMMDKSDFILDSLFCEWAYIVNLDDNVLEVYRGFNKNPDAPGRYAKFKIEKDKDYCGVALLATISLSDRSMSVQDFLQNIAVQYYNQPGVEFWPGPPPGEGENDWEDGEAETVSCTYDTITFKQNGKEFRIPLSQVATSL